MLKRLHLLLALFILTVNAAMAQITTSGISGKISSNSQCLNLSDIFIVFFS